MSDRPMRSCDVCGKIDNHPRHIFAAGNSVYQVNTDAVETAYANTTVKPAELVAIVRDLEDTTSLTRHMDCCRQAGCPTGDCDNMPEAQQKLKGLALVEAITGEKA